VDTIEEAEDREKFQQLLHRLALSSRPTHRGTMIEARSEALKWASRSVRPSYVLGGRAMEICYDQPQFDAMCGAFVAAQGQRY